MTDERLAVIRDILASAETTLFAYQKAVEEWEANGSAPRDPVMIDAAMKADGVLRERDRVLREEVPYLLDEIGRLKQEVEKAQSLNLSLAERCRVQSEAKRAEVKP